MDAVREVTAEEAGLVGGGEWSNAEFAAYSAYGSELGASAGAALFGSASPVGAVVFGGLIGGALGGMYYAAGELMDYCF
jgi:hypothetical protein